MATPENIPVSGGLVTSRDPTRLEKGEVSRADDTYYKPSDPALYKVPAKSAANATSEGAIYGARYLEFDGATDRIVIGTGTTYRISAATPSNLIFSDLVTGLAGSATTLDS